MSIITKRKSHECINTMIVIVMCRRHKICSKEKRNAKESAAAIGEERKCFIYWPAVITDYEFDSDIFFFFLLLLLVHSIIFICPAMDAFDRCF